MCGLEPEALFDRFVERDRFLAREPVEVDEDARRFRFRPPVARLTTLPIPWAMIALIAAVA